MMLCFQFLKMKAKDLFGTENGISSYLPARMIFENYGNVFILRKFYENSCCITKDKNILFGSVSGILLLDRKH